MNGFPYMNNTSDAFAQVELLCEKITLTEYNINYFYYIRSKSNKPPPMCINFSDQTTKNTFIQLT